MVGIVVVSHSFALAQAAVALAEEMVPPDARPPLRIAAGLDTETFGTDAAAISAALEELDSSDGTLVLVDLGSAVLSAEMACEFVEPEVAARVRISSAPLVEGLVAAVVGASVGLSLDELSREAEGALAAKQEHLGGVDSVQTETAEPEQLEALALDVPIINAHGLHARPAAALVAGLRPFSATVMLTNAATGRGPVPATSLTKIATLDLRCGQTLRAAATGPDAQAALDALAAMAADAWGEREESPVVPGESVSTASLSQSTGRELVVGPAFVLATDVDVSGYTPGDTATELARLEASYAAVRAQLGLPAAGVEGEIAAAQLVLLDDPELVSAVQEDIRGGASQVESIQRQHERVAAEFAGLSDPYLRARAEDVRGIQRQLLAAAMGVAPRSLQPATASVYVVDELDAQTAAALDPALCLGVITITGGRTGHGVIVATSRGIPMLCGQAEAATVTTGEQLGFDPVTQEFWLRPDDATVVALRQRSAERNAEDAEVARLANQPALTSHGQRIVVACNVGSLDDARRGAAAGAEGSGLVRTEVLFGQETQAPSAQKQAELFIAIGRALGGAGITIRTWDVGGDKPLAFLPQDSEANPFLGERGLRTMRRVPELFRMQLRGILLASRETPVQVLLPMVTEPEEVVWARAILEEEARQLGLDCPPLGAMIEVPSAALRADEIAPLIDFASVGTNDLAQYTTAADRTNARVASLARGDSPAILKLIERTCCACGEKPVAVCGDLASDPSQTAALLRCGVRELSVRPPIVGHIKHAVRQS